MKPLVTAIAAGLAQADAAGDGRQPAGQ